MKRKKVISIYFFQLFFNLLWSVLFFGLKSPLLGLIDIIVLLIFIIANTIVFYKISKTAGYLLIPYLLWVSFASILNFSIFILN
jgi:tryptophan-rich sensory protein